MKNPQVVINQLGDFLVLCVSIYSFVSGFII